MFQLPRVTRAAFCAGLLILAAGCAGSRPAALERDLPSNFPNHTFEQIRMSVREAFPDTVHSFRAKASIVIRSPEQSGSFSADIHERIDDSLYVSISPGLGIEAARALVTPDSFFFYDRIKNRLLYGSLEDADGILPQPFMSDDLFESLLGLSAPPGDTEFDVEADSSYYHLTDPSGLITYTVDPAFWRLVAMTRHRQNGTLVEVRSYSEFDRFGGIVLPRRVEFLRPGEERRASIYYRSLTLNPEELSFDLEVRDSADRVQSSR